MAQKINTSRIRTNLRKLNKDVLRKAGKTAVNFSKQAFRKQGWEDSILSPWAKRRTQNKSDRRRGSGTRGILIESGALRRSIGISGVYKNRVRVVADRVYAKRHNRGLSGMPKRQFMGKSRALNKKVERVLSVEAKKIFK